MKMRKGYSLMEMIVVLAVVAMIMNIIAGVFVTAVGDIPRSLEAVQANTTVLDLLRQIENDVEAADALPASFGEYRQNDAILLVETKRGVICYSSGDEGITRRVLDGEQNSGEGGDIMRWSPPNARIEWRVVDKQGVRFAVEVRSRIELEVSGRVEKKMAGARLYFVGATKEAVK